MKLVSLVRHKNGKKYLPRLVKQLTDLSDAVVFLDDNSDDGSYEDLLRYKNSYKEFHVIRRTSGEWSGGLDWQALFKYAEKFDPKFLFVPDVDELLEESEAHKIHNLIDQSGPDVVGWSFPFYYLWNDEKHFRDDGTYKNTSVIRLIRFDKRFPPPDRATHATAVSDKLDRRMIRMADVRMWHFGYMDEADRKRKYEFYNTRDKNPEAAGSGGKNYDHMVNSPEILPTVPSLEEWSSATNAVYGDYLLRSPRRVSTGAFFPCSVELKLGDLKKLKDISIDELRISYHFDGMELPETNRHLAEAFRVLRPGGRLEVIANDFDNICEDFVKGNLEKKAVLQPRFLSTPHKEPLKIAMSADILASILRQVLFESVQAIPVEGFPYRLYMIGYKPQSGSK